VCYELTVSASIQIVVHEFVDLKQFLYYPKRLSLPACCIKRVWAKHDIGNSDTFTDVFADTEMMASLPSSGLNEQEFQPVLERRKPNNTSKT
jgi:hypothetical protein